MTVLLWGPRWRLPTGESADIPSPGAAADVLLTLLAGRASSLRLIYQPDDFRSVVSPCPLGGRKTLQTALGFEHPEIQSEEIAWSFEPVLPRNEGHETILHREAKPALLELAASLRARGIPVVSAWPLATYLHALPDEWPDSGGFALLAVREGHGLAYHHPSSGTRAIREWHGPSALGQALAWLTEERTRHPDDATLLVADDAELFAQQYGIAAVPVHTALAAAPPIPRSHPAQLLPPEPVVTAQRAVMAASILLLLGAGWSGARYVQAYRAAEIHRQDQAMEKSRLLAEIEHFRVNRTEMVALRARLAGPGTGLPIADWLAQLCTGVPPSIALSGVKVEQTRFTVDGFASSQTGEAFGAWKSRLAGPRWRIDTATAPGPNGAFHFSGSFTP